MTTAQQTVVTAVARLFGEKDASAIDDFFGPVYVQHSALGVDGLDGIRGLMANLPPAFHYELVRSIAEGDLVVTHGLYSGYGPAPVVGFDVWRVADGRIVEHWDALAPSSSADPRAAVDGPVVADIAVDSEESRRIALAGPTGDLVEHAPALGAAGPYSRGTVHQVIADGDLVFTRGEGTAGDAPAIVNDLWRVADGRVAEHWTLISLIPAQLPHGNGVF
ncbi:nuclear transport factor 2 family protein [Schumannella luteola]